MKNWKKYAALAGVAALLVVFCLPMVFALKGDFSMNLFMASLAGVLFVAVMAYVILMLFRYLNKKNGEPLMNTEIRNVIFDVGNVLVDFSWQEYLESFHFPKEESEAIANAVFKNEIWNERDQGLLEEEEYIERMCAAAPEYAEDIRLVMQTTGKCIHERPFAETWMQFLKSKGCSLYILSNYSKGTFEQSQKKMHFLKYMEGAIFSYEVKLIKPDPKIFELLLNRYGLVPQECVFIDDRPDNCETAEKLGIHAINFTSFKQAAGELEKLGIK